ncbi:ATPase [Kickxella alabastrina]|uniref:ATPase n=1 Tax=Kickxella alabastrina TaxID=61397 RepID=A0ACC1IP80_9FUNG|nr:ATPase [Kickxella alabastrina]
MYRQPLFFTRRVVYKAAIICSSTRSLATASAIRPLSIRNTATVHTASMCNKTLSAISAIAPVTESPASMHSRPHNGGPIDEYARLVKAGEFIDDSFQRTIVTKLDRLYQDLLEYTPSSTTEPPKSGVGSLWKQLLGKSKSDGAMPVGTPRGLYIYGDVGTGKTTTMDLFYDTVPTMKKRRIHFHAFMLDIHRRINSFRCTHASTADPIPTIAKELASSVYVLCFDEFQVTDIADAMVLRRLVTELFRNGVIIVTTSNRHPDELYKNGIQRESFLPCIALLKERCEVVSLDSGTDYRKVARETETMYFSSLSPDTNKVLHALFALASGGATLEHNLPLQFLGRTLNVPLAADGVARFNFVQLCKEAHSAADYIELAKHYHTIFLTDVPVMDMSDRNEARRFITLIDALYESHTMFFMSSESDIYHLFKGQDALVGAEKTDLAYSGEEEVFAFQRAVSRLVEMSSRRWIIAGRNRILAENALRMEVEGGGSEHFQHQTAESG